MRGVIVDAKGVIANVVVVPDPPVPIEREDGTFFTPRARWSGPPKGFTFAAYDDPAQIGWAWDGKAAIAPQKPAPPVLPISVSRLRFKLELADRGLLANVEAAVAQAGDTAQLYWAEATEIEENHPLVVQIGGALGLTSDAIHEMFVSARDRNA